jgi:hypothetical protein
MSFQEREKQRLASLASDRCGDCRATSSHTISQPPFESSSIARRGGRDLVGIKERMTVSPSTRGSASIRPTL